MGIKLSVGNAISTLPAIGKELYRTDERGEKQLLTGFDYNQELAIQRTLRDAALKNPHLRQDAVIALEEQLRARRQGFLEQPRKPLAAEEFLPMDPQAAQWADHKKYLWELRTPYGSADLHASLNGITEAPDVSEDATFEEGRIISAVISYGTTVEQDMIGRLIGYNFMLRGAELARRTMAETFDNFMLTGANVGGETFYGLFNQPSSVIAPVTATTGSWYTLGSGGTTVDEILTDFQALFNSWQNATYQAGALNTSMFPDTVAMSDRIYSLLALNVVDGTNRMSILEQLKIFYPEVQNWLPHRGLRDIGVGSKDRIIMYDKNPEVVAGGVPVPYQERPLISEPFGEKVYAFGRVAEVKVFDSRLIHYLDIDMTA